MDIIHKLIYNKAKYNIELIKEKDDIIVLASHNGNNYNSYFGNLKNISLGDTINYYYAFILKGIYWGDQSGGDGLKFREHAFLEGFRSRCASRRRKSVSAGAGCSSPLHHHYITLIFFYVSGLGSQ